jgi:hypothetical protein
MNPVAAVGAVAQEPLATLQALAERLNPAPGAAEAQQPLSAAGAEADVFAPDAATAHGLTPDMAPAPTAALGSSISASRGAAFGPAISSTLQAAQAEALATAQAQQGLKTLGQLAQQSQAHQGPLQTSALPTAAAENTSLMAQMALAAPQLAPAPGAGAASGAVLLAVPVLMSPWQTQHSSQAQRHPAVQPEPAHEQRRRQPEGNADGGAQPDTEIDAQIDEEPALPSPQRRAQPREADTLHDDSQALLASLRQHGSVDVQRELQAGRRVLVVLPQSQADTGRVKARAALLGLAGVRLFLHTRWWPGEAGQGLDGACAGRIATTPPAPWPQWRVFREGDALHAPLLVSRSDGPGCRVLLGVPAPRLFDSRNALLELPERLRFMQALGGQWSVLLVVAPTGVAP